MLKKIRKSSGRVTLVLIGLSAIAGCGKEQETRRDVYASREDCLADWGNKPQDCTPATEKRHQGGGFFYGPIYALGAMNAMRGGSGSAWTTNNSARPGSKAIGSSSAGSPSRSSGGVSRGGFGSSGHSSAS
ncbi:MAG TPA: hypothetical protein VM122_07125 [Usitatibacter sp.]|nr:hypothetical protein [Usitatibacter sp.]